MKLHLPSRLVQALFTTGAAVLSTSPAFADVPSGYTPVIITDVEQLADYTQSDNMAFIISADITDSAYRMTGRHQYWTDVAEKSHALTFSELEGGAIAGTAVLTGHGSVVFSDNSAGSGGAIMSGGDEPVYLTGNDTVLFSGNKALYGEGGGAINGYNVEISNNGDVTFRGNAAIDGGAIFGSAELTGNKSVHFIENTTNEEGGIGGGAILACFGISLAENEEVIFLGNTSSTCGGAISCYYESIFSLTNNDLVKFTGNGAWSGGAISTDQAWGEEVVVNITGNGDVEFRGNYEKRTDSRNTDTFRLRSVSMDNYYYSQCSYALNLSAGEGQRVTFYDTLYAESGTEISFNGAYEDKEGKMQEGSGDIIFSGKHAKEDLAELKSNYTQQELTDSLTTEVYTTTNLYGGRLRIEDGAIYKGNGINVAAGSGATLALRDGTLDHTGYGVLINDGTTLSLDGMNSITAGTLELANGSTLTFNLDSQEGAPLNLNAILLTGKTTLSLQGDLTKEHDLIRLSNESQYDTSLWTIQNITVKGADYGALTWTGGVLHYTPLTTGHIILDKDTEMVDSGDYDKLIVEGNTHKLTLTGGVHKIRFIDMDNGTVRMEGQDNTMAHIRLTDNSRLELASGADMTLGNGASLAASPQATAAVEGEVEMTDEVIRSLSGKGRIMDTDISTASDFLIKDMSISGSLIDVGRGTRLYLVNVDIKADTRITDEAAWLDMQATKAWLDESNTQVGRNYTTNRDMTLFRSGDMGRTITLAAGSDIVELTSEMFDTVTLTGTDLWLDLTAMAEATYGKDYFTLNFQNLAHSFENAQIDVENLRVYATLDGERYTAAYSTTSGSLATTLCFQVPEPATGTLSLLALAALAARRRRK